MECATPIQRGPLKGQMATGTHAGWGRHQKSGEAPCAACAAARALYHHEWYERNRSAVLAQSRQWAADNRARSREIKRRWVERNPEKIAEVQRRYYLANQAKKAAQQRRWNAANRERVREWGRRRRSRLATRSIPYTVDDLLAKIAYWGSACWMCGGPFEELDHVIPISKGGWHCLSNLRPSCATCNHRKHARPWKEFAA